MDNKNLKVFLRTSCVFSILVYARLLVFDKTSAQPHFAAVNCSDAVTSVLYSLL